MEVLMSNWSEVQSLPENYIFPAGRRPGKHIFPVYKDMPIIDLQKARPQLVQDILKASQDFGFFQVINHGVDGSLMEETMSVVKEFFSMPAEYKARFYSTDTNKSCRIYSSTLHYEKEDVHYWRDNFTHRCHPLEDYIQIWPDKPSRYRDVTGKYCVELRKFLMRILDLIGEGLGLEKGYFEDELSQIQLLSVNHHIPCPDPSLTLGMPEHCDINLITMLHQETVPGLQLFKDGEWLNVESIIPTAFIVLPGLQLKAISNDVFRSPVHRVMTNVEHSRTTIGTFLTPSADALIKPAKVDGHSSSPVYTAYKYKDFLTNLANLTRNKSNSKTALEFFKIKNQV